MLQINAPAFLGKQFKTTTGPAGGQEYICIGFGQNPDGSNYVIGAKWDDKTNTTVIYTELFKRVEFIGNPLNIVGATVTAPV